MSPKLSPLELLPGELRQNILSNILPTSLKNISQTSVDQFAFAASSIARASRVIAADVEYLFAKTYANAVREGKGRKKQQA